MPWRSVFHDPSVTGSYTRDTYSPKALLVNTLGDRIKRPPREQAWSMPSPRTPRPLSPRAGGLPTVPSGSTARSPHGPARATTRRCPRASRPTTAPPKGLISASSVGRWHGARSVAIAHPLAPGPTGVVASRTAIRDIRQRTSSAALWPTKRSRALHYVYSTKGAMPRVSRLVCWLSPTALTSLHAKLRVS